MLRVNKPAVAGRFEARNGGSRLLVRAGLRTRAWIEDNRRLVDKLSGGRLAYVWLPNTAGPGYTSFIRYFYSPSRIRKAPSLTRRYNQGGMVADFIVNELDRKPMGFFALRDGNTFFSRPISGVYGPKVMLINRSAGSGGRRPARFTSGFGSWDRLWELALGAA